MSHNYVDDAIAFAGGKNELAAVLGVTRQYIHKASIQGWLPLDRARQVEDLYGIEREKLVKPSIRDFILAED